MASSKSDVLEEKNDQSLDVSSMLGTYEEKPIELVDPQATAIEPHQGNLSDKLKEDLKVSYPAKGILDVTFGGYGFLRKNYTINPNEDTYVSTSQIRRFWLRKGDEVEGLARPPKDGERFHSLLLIQKINGQEISEQQSRTRKKYDDLTSLHPNRQIKLEN